LTSTFSIRPQLAISLDVTHAQQPGSGPDNDPRVGSGPCIARGANVHPVVFEKLRAAAVEGAVPHHVTVYGGNTETNAWMMQVAGEGVPTGLLELPLRYMHTSVETVHLEDITQLAELLRRFVAALTPEDATALQGETYSRVAPRAKASSTAKAKRPPAARARVKRATVQRLAARASGNKARRVTAKSSRRGTTKALRRNTTRAKKKSR
jgi:hypothetical protein